MPETREWHLFLAELQARQVDGLEIAEAEPLAGHTTLRIGGAARFVLRCHRPEAVGAVVKAARLTDIPWLVLGLGANVLVPDEGLAAAVVMLAGDLTAIRLDGARLQAGGGAHLSRVVRAAIDAGLAGVECLGGIPSTLGGALAMNAGAYGQEILEVLAWADVVEEDGSLRRLERWEVHGGYRWSVLGKGRVVTSAELSLHAEDPEVLRARVAQVREKRRGVLPPEPSAGSVFRNPPGDFAGRLLELAGCKGLESGGARVSERHANVIVNTGGATAAGVRNLVRQMATRVRDRFGVALELELKVLDSEGGVVVAPATELA